MAWLLKAGVAAALLAWLLAQVDLHALTRLLADQSPTGLLGAIVIVCLALVVGTFKWWLLLPDEPFFRLLRLNIAANFYALVVPGQVGAEAIKTYQLGRGRVDAEAIAASVVLDKITGLLSLLALGVVGAVFSSLPLGQVSRVSLAALLVLCFAVLVGLRFPVVRAFAVGCVRTLQAAMPRLRELGNRIILFVDAWCNYLSKPGVILASLAAGVLQQSIYVVMISLLSRQLGFELPLLDWCWIFGLASAAAVLPITIAGLGVREGVFVGLLASVSIPAEQALALSLTIFAIQVVLGLFGGLVELLRVARSG